MTDFSKLSKCPPRNQKPRLRCFHWKVVNNVKYWSKAFVFLLLMYSKNNCKCLCSIFSIANKITGLQPLHLISTVARVIAVLKFVIFLMLLSLHCRNIWSLRLRLREWWHGLQRPQIWKRKTSPSRPINWHSDHSIGFSRMSHQISPIRIHCNAWTPRNHE